jgi:hypothetical protein
VLSANFKQSLLLEIENETQEISKSEECYDKLYRVRADKLALKQILSKQLNDVTLIINNLDENIENKEHKLNYRKQSLDFKKNIISKFLHSLFLIQIFIL